MPNEELTRRDAAGDEWRRWGPARPFAWSVALDTADPSVGADGSGPALDPAAALALGPRSLVVLRGVRAPDAPPTPAWAPLASA